MSKIFVYVLVSLLPHTKKALSCRQGQKLVKTKALLLQYSPLKEVIITVTCISISWKQMMTFFGSLEERNVAYTNLQTVVIRFCFHLVYTFC